MATNRYIFDPSTYDAREVTKPLSQLMREAEVERSREAARMWRNAVRRIAGAFSGRREPATDGNSRLAA